MDARPDVVISIDAAAVEDGGSDALLLPEGLFVHGDVGQDLPDHGTISEPFKTIQYAIERAEAPTAVHVAAGTYQESIALRDQVTLLGGYSASDWSDRDPQAWDDPEHRTAIVAAGNIGVRAGEGVGEATLLEGFYVEGGIETHDHHSHGLYLWDGAVPLIRSNMIHGGYGDHYSTGITTVSGAAPTITRNIIKGGDAPTTYALRLNESTALVANNILSGHSGTEESCGVLVSNASPVIVNNTIDAGSATTAYGFFLFSIASPEIYNNIIVATGTDKGYGVFEATLNGDAAHLQNNDFFGCTTALYRDWGGTPSEITDIADLHALADTAASGNVAVNPSFVSPTDLHLQQSSPLEVTEGGLDKSTLGIDSDMDGNPRTPPWSIGAYEQD